MKIIEPKLIYHENSWKPGMAVVVEDGIIQKIDQAARCRELFPKALVATWKELAMIPGTVNAHNHCFQSLLRGLEVGKPFLEWRDKALYRISPFLTPEDLYTGAVFAFGEMMKHGVTTVSDFFYVHNHGLEGDYAIIRAAKDVGIRLVLARTMYDWDKAPKGYVETVEEAVHHTRLLAQEFNGTNHQMTTILPAPHSLHAATPKMVQAGHRLAKELHTKFHIHVAEEPFEVEEIQKKYGMRPVEYLEHLGVLDDSMVMIHAVWLSQQELQLMADRKAGLAYCPSSNMFLADGVTEIGWMLEHGIRIGLGSDGACSNNRISVFEEMRMSSLLQKVTRLNALLVTTEEAFDMGTRNGGLLLDLPVGELKEGMYADFLGIDLNDISLQPLFEDYRQLLPNIVYSMQPSAIRKVVINGETTMADGNLHKISEEEIVKKVNRLMSELYHKVSN